MGSNVFGGGQGSSSGGGGGNVFGGGGGGTRPRPTRAQARRLAAKAVDQQKGGGGLLGAIKETGGIIRGLPGGTIHLVGDVGKEVGHRTVGMAEGIGQAGAGIIHGDPNEVLRGLAKSQWEAPYNPAQTVVNVGKGIAGGENAKPGNDLVSTALGQSFRRTGHRVTHPDEYVQAYKEGHLVGAALEDIGNVALVAGGVTKGIDAAAGRAFSQAETARATAEMLNTKTIPALEKQVAEGEARLAADTPALVEQAQAHGPTAEMWKQAQDAQAALDGSRTALQQAKDQAAAHAAKADELVGSQSKAIMRAYRLAHSVETLGAQGANLPAKPFGLAAKALGSGAAKLLDLAPGLKQALGDYAQAAVERVAGKRGVRSTLSEHNAERDALLHGFHEAIDRMDRVLRDEDLWHATMLDLTGANRLLADAYERFRVTAGDQAAKEALDRIAASPEMEASARAVELSFKIARGELDPATMQRVREAQAIYEDRIARPIEQRYLAGRGTTAPLTEEGLAQRQWEVSGRGPNPMKMQALQERQALATEAAQQRITDAAAAAEKAQGKITLPPAAVKDLSGTVARNVELSIAAADRIVTEALSNPALMEQLQRIPGFARAADQEAMVQSLAAAIEKAAGSQRLARRFPVLGAAVRENALTPIRLRGLEAPSFAPVERAAAASAKAEAEAAHAQRLQATAERLKGQEPAVVERAVRATERVLRARARAEAAAQAGARARQEIASGASLPAGDLPDWMVGADEYARRHPPVEGQQTSLAGAQAEHARVVADAMEQRQVVPPWVVDEYLPARVPKRPENTPGVTHWDPITGAARTSAAKSWLAESRRINEENAALGATPEAARIRAMQSRNTRAWKASAMGKAYQKALDNVESMRRGIVDAAKSELHAIDAHGTLPEQLPFVPGGLSEYADQAAQSLGGREWRVLDAVEGLRAKRGGANLPDEDLWVRAYNQEWRRLPTAARESLDRLTEQEVRALYRRWRARTLDPEMLRLDERVDEWARGQPGLDALDHNAKVAAFLDAFGQRNALRRIVNSGTRGGFAEADLRAFFDATTDPEILALRDDALSHQVLSAGTRANAARALFEGDLAGANRPALALPPAEEWRRVWQEQPSANMTSLEDVAYQVFGDQVPAEEFLSRWVRAGEPDLAQVYDELAAGRPPAWAQDLTPAAEAGAQAVTRAEGRVAAASRMDQADEALRYPEAGQRPGRAHLTAAERAIQDEAIAARRALNPEADVAAAVGQGGASRFAALAESQQRRADVAAARAEGQDLAAARQKAAVGAVAPVAEQFVRHGKELKAYQQALSDLRFSERRLAALPVRQAREMQAAMDDLRNAPARLRAPLTVARSTAAVFDTWAKELADQGLTNPNLDYALNQVQLDLVKTLRDLNAENVAVAGPGGTLRPAGEPFEAAYVPGGKLREGAGTGKGAPPKLAKSAGERVRRSGVIASTPRELQQVLTQRVTREVGNEAARQIEAVFGVRPSQILGEERAAALGQRITDAEKYRDEAIAARRAEIAQMGPGEVRDRALDQLKRDIEAMDRNVGGERKAAAEALVAEMRDQGYRPWNPRALFPTTDNPRALGTSVLEDPTQITTATLWVPEQVTKMFDEQFRGAGAVERAFRKYYDRPTNVWKAAVLALSPRWHVNNIIGNFVMATLGAGITPTAWAKSMIDAHALLRADELKFRAEHADALGLTERQAARAGRGLARAEARIGRIDPEALAAVRGPEGLHLDPRIPQRGAGTAALDPYTEEAVSRGRVREALHRTVQGSYHFNGFVDDMNRVAVFLERYKHMSGVELAKFAADNPSLAALKGDLGALKQEAAVRMSLDALGNFRQMSTFERSFVRRAFPFYAWMRHITKLAFRLPITSPVRVVWFLHLADLYGEPPAYSFLTGTVPLGGGSFLRLPRGNPFEDVVGIPASGDPRDIALAAGGSVGPIPRMASLGLTGIDPRTLQQIKRPAGTGRLDEYGNPKFSPVSDPLQLLSIAADSTPQGRLGRAITDRLKYGSPRLRYPTGEPMRTGSGATIPSGRSVGSELSGLIGFPYTTKVDVARLKQAETQRRQAQARSKARSQRRPVSTGTGGSNIFGR